MLRRTTKERTDGRLECRWISTLRPLREDIGMRKRPGPIGGLAQLVRQHPRGIWIASDRPETRQRISLDRPSRIERHEAQQHLVIHPRAEKVTSHRSASHTRSCPAWQRANLCLTLAQRPAQLLAILLAGVSLWILTRQLEELRTPVT